jgi:hypothetical protein
VGWIQRREERLPDPGRASHDEEEDTGSGVPSLSQFALWHRHRQRTLDKLKDQLKTWCRAAGANSHMNDLQNNAAQEINSGPFGADLHFNRSSFTMY